MRFDVGLFDRLFGRKVEIDLSTPEGRPVKRRVTKRWFAKMEEEGKVSQVEKPVVRAHILDPGRGYYVENWIVGEHVPKDTAERFLDPATACLYVLRVWREGEPEVNVVQKVLWDRARAEMGLCSLLANRFHVRSASASSAPFAFQH